MSTILSIVANKKYVSSSKQASRYEEDVQEAITKCSKNINRNIEDAQDEASRAIRQLAQTIEDLTPSSEVNCDKEIAHIFENAREYEPKEFLLTLDRIFQHEEAEKAHIADSAELVAKLQKGYNEGKRLLDMGEDLLSVDNIKLGEASQLNSLQSALRNLYGCYAAKARMGRIKALLASEASEDVIKQD